VIFGVAANVSISKLFIAGIFPGILLGAALWGHLVGTWCARRKIEPAAASQPAGRAARLKDATFALGLPLIVIVGLKFRRVHADRGGVVAGGLRAVRRRW
jgi:TRAP-type C4-dicarboxylate transport system permease large subunit